jgi:hypothetical protein
MRRTSSWCSFIQDGDGPYVYGCHRGGAATGGVDNDDNKDAARL